MLNFLFNEMPFLLMIIALIFFYIVITIFTERSKKIDDLFFLVLLIIILPDLFQIFEIVTKIVKAITTTMYALVPVLASISLVLQGVMSVFNWNPVLLIVVQFLLWISENLFVPSIILAMLADIWSRGIPSISVTRLAQFIRSGLLIIMGVGMMILTLVLTISGTLVLTLNKSVTMPIKAIVEQSIPIVGSIVVQALSMMKKAQVVTSGAFSASFILFFISIFAIPLVTLLIKATVYRVLSIVSEPFLPSDMTGVLDDISKSLFTLCGVVAIIFSCVVVLLMILFALFTAFNGSG